MRDFFKFIKNYTLICLIVLTMTVLSISGYVMSVFTLATSESPDVFGYVKENVFAGVALHELKENFAGKSFAEFAYDNFNATNDDDSEMGKDTWSEPDFNPDKVFEKNSDIYINHQETLRGLEERERKHQQNAANAKPNAAETAAENEDSNGSISDETEDEEVGKLIKYDADNNYFLDSLFIGDSRMVGFCMYSGMPNITAYTQKSFQLYTIGDKAIIKSELGNITVPQALMLQPDKFKKVYIKFGLNELGYDEEKFDKYYYALIDLVKSTQSDAVVYVQSIIHVTEEKDEDSSIISNMAIDERNKHIKQIAENENVIYLDLNEVFTNDNNCLPSEYSSDGVHLKGEYLKIWADYLKSHAYVRNTWDIPKFDVEFDSNTFPTLMNTYITGSG